MQFAMPSFSSLFLMLFAVLLIANQTVAFDRRMLPDSTADLAADGAKRNWNNAAVGLWGKRSLPSHFFVSDDSRSVVKRPEDSWTKLNSLWGKRSSWQTATGLWGKRSVVKRFDSFGVDE
uniref:Uncharacterized protein n=1 Tax=Panagrolaimus sp. JU765 TaxID=591449 RepID=A0AC34R327_9BILA